MNRAPEHIAIIMDGNGRWATSKNLSRSEGHRQGTEAVDKLLDIALELGLRNISLYAFSTENWKRPVLEIKSIFSLLEEYISKRLDEISKKGVKIVHSGSRKLIPPSSLKKIDEAKKVTEKNKKLTVNFCLNYGSHEEITNAFNIIIKARQEKNKDMARPIKAKEIAEALYTHPLPPVDLLIRTGGEKRISNFLLWQIAYAEIYFTDILWPDFDRKELTLALEWFSSRQRRFGGL